MPGYPKIKREKYEALGGLNQKISRYIEGQGEFLKLQNLDAYAPGALSSMPGTTQSVLSGTTGIITGIADFYRSSPSFGQQFATYNLVATTQFNAGNFTGATYSPFYSFLFPNNTTQSAFAENDALFIANGYDYFRYPGSSLVVSFSAVAGPTSSFGYTFFSVSQVDNFSSALQYSLPKPGWFYYIPFAGSSGNANGMTGNIYLAAAFVRSDGFVGPAIFATYTANGNTLIHFPFPTFSIYNGVSGSIGFTPFGIVGTRIWLNYEADGLGYLPFAPAAGSSLPSQGPLSDYFLIRNYDELVLLRSGGDISVGASNVNLGVRDFIPERNGVGEPDDYQGTFLYGPDGDSGGYVYTVLAPQPPSSPLQPQNPACLESFNNFLFMAGFQYQPSTFYWSRVGEFEKRDVENFAEFRANDGDIISCLKAYFTQLIIFKINSVGALSGASSDSFQLVEVTDQYGCLSPQGACVFQQRLWFLDKKGICEYNGANTDIVSNKVEDYFRRMNVNAARKVASMVNIKEINQIQCSIPIDGATFCNQIIFYDYLSNIWGTRSIENATALAVTQQGVNKPVERYGSASGMLFAYGQSLATDNGSAFTCVAQSQFMTIDGLHSEEKMFRRLYLDASVPSGQTYIFALNFYKNQGVSPVLSATMAVSNAGQNRYEFGISGESLSVEMIYSGGNFLRLNGFTIEARFQRLVGGRAV